MNKEDITSLWAAEEEAARALLAAPGVPHPDQVAGLSAMQVFDAISAGRLPQPPMGDTLDFIPIRIEPGKAIFQGRPNKRHYNPMGTVHGGWFAAMLDSALGCAVHSTLPVGKGYTTLELKVNLVRADGCGALRTGRGYARACREAGGHVRGPHRRAGRQAVCTRNDHLPDLRPSAWQSMTRSTSDIVL